MEYLTSVPSIIMIGAMVNDSWTNFLSAKTANDFSVMLSFVVSVLRVMEEISKITSEADETGSRSDMSDVQDAMKHTAKMERDKYLKLLSIMQSVSL